MVLYDHIEVIEELCLYECLGQRLCIDQVAWTLNNDYPRESLGQMHVLVGGDSVVDDVGSDATDPQTVSIAVLTPEAPASRSSEENHLRSRKFPRASGLTLAVADVGGKDSPNTFD